MSISTLITSYAAPGALGDIIFGERFYLPNLHAAYDDSTLSHSKSSKMQHMFSDALGQLFLIYLRSLALRQELVKTH